MLFLLRFSSVLLRFLNKLNCLSLSKLFRLVRFSIWYLPITFDTYLLHLVLTYYIWYLPITFGTYLLHLVLTYYITLHLKCLMHAVRILALHYYRCVVHLMCTHNALNLLCAVHVVRYELCVSY
jgi:hypothetical protein